MKKLAAILFILVLFFNIGGYRILTSFLEKEADEKLGLRLDNNDYTESQLIEIRIALNMPYQERYTEFERHYGEIEVDGKSYTHVKRKIQGDILILKCIPNESKQELKAINDEWTKSNSTADNNQPAKSSKNSLAKNSGGEYDDQHGFQTMRLNFLALHNYFSYSFFIPDRASNTPHQPPEAFAVPS